MKRIFGTILVLLCAIAAGANTPSKHVLPVGDFDKLKVVNSINVIYRCNPDSAGLVVFNTPHRLADIFAATNSKGCLKLETNIIELPDRNLPTVYVYSTALEYVENAGDSTVIVDSPIRDIDKFKIKMTGNGKIVVDDLKCGEVAASIATGSGSIVIGGECKKAVFRIFGTGNILSDRLNADAVVCKIMGTGTIGCHPIKRLDVKGIGSTKIYYLGDPIVKKHGGGKLFHMETAE